MYAEFLHSCIAEQDKCNLWQKLTDESRVYRGDSGKEGREVAIKSLYDYCIERYDFVSLYLWNKAKGCLTARDISYGKHKLVRQKCQFARGWAAAMHIRAWQAGGGPQNRPVAMLC